MRILVCDDENLARLRLTRALSANHTLAEAGDGIEALELFATFKPDVILLDIEMPELNGLEVAAQLADQNAAIIFQTAYDEFAVKAFEVNACDYLLKPFTDERLHQALSRAEARTQKKSEPPAPSGLGKYLADEGRFLQRFAVNVGSKVKVIEAEEVHCFFSIDHITHISLKEIDYAYQTSLKTLGEQLDPKIFGRIHRNCIVKWSEVATVNRGTNMSVRLKNGKDFQVSRESRQLVKERLGF